MAERAQSERSEELEKDLDDLFKRPPAEFTSARNALAGRLKKAGNADEADRVKALAKPTITAWAVNQLYWSHRDAFDRLIATGERVRQAQSKQLGGEAADIRGPLEARREALSELSRLAATVLQNAGQTTSPDKLHRISTTLAAISAYGTLHDGPSPGRLTDDVDPPGFESLVIPGISQPTRVAATSSSLTSASPAASKAALESAERDLSMARATAQKMEAAAKEAAADADEMERRKRDAKERFDKASAAAEDAQRRRSNAAAEAEQAAKALADAERAVEKAKKELKKQ